MITENKSMDRQGCCCSDEDTKISCELCDSEAALPYWCETCQRLVAEKRCPCCGLKARKVRQPGSCD